MYNIIIDNSYLHSASRCANSEAKSSLDIVNFFRFLGEIISHQEIFVTVNKIGSVYKKSSDIIEHFKQISGNSLQIKVLPQEIIDYKSIIEKVSKIIIDIKFMGLFSYCRRENDWQPEFIDNNPDIELHQWITGISHQLPEFASLKSGATFVPLLIAFNIGLREEIKKIKRKWTLQDSIILAAKLRTLVYTQVAISNKMNYIPSATRGCNSNNDLTYPSLRSLMFDEIYNYKDFKDIVKSNEYVVSGIIARNGCIPKNSLIDALSIRNKTIALREYFFNKPILRSGDSLLLYKYSQLKELEKIKNEFIKNGEFMIGLDALTPSISSSSADSEVSISLPIVEGAFKMINYYQQNQNLKKMQDLILPIFQLKTVQRSRFIKNLELYSGLK